MNSCYSRATEFIYTSKTGEGNFRRLLQYKSHATALRKLKQPLPDLCARAWIVPEEEKQSFGSELK